MAYKNNLLEYYGGGTVPNRQGYQGGGSIGNSLLGLQYGGPAYSGGSRVMGNLGRFRSITKATKDVQRRAKQIKSKKKKAGLFGKVFGKAAEWGTKALLAPILGPGALLAAKTVGSGVGAYFGAKLGYGDKVGTGLDKTKWLAGEREKLGAAEGDLGDLYKGIAGKQAMSTAKAGGKEFLKDVGAKSWEDYGQTKWKEWTESKPDLGKIPMGGGMAPAKLPGDLSEQYAGSPEGYTGGLPSAKTLDYTPTGLGAGRKALGDKPLIGSDFISQKLSEPYAGSPEGYTGGDFRAPEMPIMGGGFSPAKAPSLGGADPFEYAQSGFGAQAGQQGIFGGLSSLAEGDTDFFQQQPWAQAGYQLPEPPSFGASFGEDLITGQYSPWSNMTSGAYAGPYRQRGGMVRDDRALIDMLYRR